MNSQRMILSVRAEGLPSQIEKSGFYAMPQRQVYEALEQAGFWLGPRDALETMPEFRQVIPYTVLRLKDSGMPIIYSRAKAGTESRLHSLMSIGFGGHVDLIDTVHSQNSVNIETTIIRANQREIDEEMPGTVVHHREVVGMVVYNEDDVNRVHVGVVSIWDVHNVSKNPEEDIAAPMIISKERLRALSTQGRLEHWSRMIAESLFSDCR